MCQSEHVDTRMKLRNVVLQVSRLRSHNLLCRSYGSNIKYKPIVYAQRMGWIGDDGKVTPDGQQLVNWILDADEEF